MDNLSDHRSLLLMFLLILLIAFNSEYIEGIKEKIYVNHCSCLIYHLLRLLYLIVENMRRKFIIYSIHLIKIR